nr:MarR family transcriptional regulator [uncultured Cetobacterium sp.]
MNRGDYKEEGCCAVEIQKLMRLTHLLEKNAFKMKGVTTSQAYTISELYLNNELTMTELSDRLALDSSTLSRNIQKLIDKGLVKKRVSEEDKRVILISLTCEGKIKALEIRVIFKNNFGKVICNIPEKDFEDIFKGVTLLLDALSKKVK